MLEVECDQSRLAKNHRASLETGTMGMGLNVLAEIYVVYDADGTVVGEVMYSIKKWLGTAHCAACDITHGPHAEKPEFTSFKNGFGVPVYNIHRDEMDIALRQCVDGRLPCVVARVESGEYIFLMGATELNVCNGSVEELQRQIATHLDLNGITPAACYQQQWQEEQDQIVPRKPNSRRIVTLS